MATRAVKKSRTQPGFWLTDFKGKIIYDTSKPHGQPRRSLDTSRATTLFGFKTKVPFAQGLAGTIEWCRETARVAEHGEVRK